MQSQLSSWNGVSPRIWLHPGSTQSSAFGSETSHGGRLPGLCVPGTERSYQEGSLEPLVVTLHSSVSCECNHRIISPCFTKKHTHLCLKWACGNAYCLGYFIDLSKVNHRKRKQLMAVDWKACRLPAIFAKHPFLKDPKIRVNNRMPYPLLAAF